MTSDSIDFPNARYHMLGIGGMGMAPMALFLKQAGCHVSGEDDNFHPRVHKLLLSNGIEISRKPDYASLNGIVFSNAIPSAHPALQSGLSRKVPCIRRGEFLALLCRHFKTLVVAGSHGKTTTCGMIVHILSRSGFACNYIMGGLFASEDEDPARFDSDSDWLVVEVDESDGSISEFEPEGALLVNIDWDHPDFYSNWNNALNAFTALAGSTREFLLYNKACRNSCDLDFSLCPGRVYSFGTNGDFHLAGFKNRHLHVGGNFRDRNLEVSFEEWFNAENAVAALAAARLLNCKFGGEVLKSFDGIWRRQETLYNGDGFCVMEDYGHHPTEIRNLLEAVGKKKGPLTVVFQPHRYSRTLQFKHQFADSLKSADRLVVMEVYGAGEAPIPGGTGSDLFNMCAGLFPAQGLFFCQNGDSVLRRLKALDIDKGVLLFLGAGDIQLAAESYVHHLRDADRGWEFSPGSPSGSFSDRDSVRRNENLALKTTLRVGGAAEYYAEPADETELKELLQEANRNRIAVNFLGRGSNIIVPDAGVKGLVIRLSKPFFRKIEFLDDGRLRAGAGVRLKQICGFARRNQLSGYEFMEGIPGCVGGSLRMNAGAMGGWISDVLSEVILMNYQGDTYEVPVEELHFGYRYCEELKEAIGLGVIFRRGNLSNLAQIQHTMDTYKSTRMETQPRLPSAGCTFKNPDGSAAGALIDQCGFKGVSVGGASVSDIHANFIINHGNATASDVIALINLIRKRVYREKGHLLEPEVILFGDQWESYLEPLVAEHRSTA